MCNGVRPEDIKAELMPLAGDYRQMLMDNIANVVLEWQSNRSLGLWWLFQGLTLPSLRTHLVACNPPGITGLPRLCPKLSAMLDLLEAANSRRSSTLMPGACGPSTL